MGSTQKIRLVWTDIWLWDLALKEATFAIPVGAVRALPLSPDLLCHVCYVTSAARNLHPSGPNTDVWKRSQDVNLTTALAFVCGLGCIAGVTEDVIPPLSSQLVQMQTVIGMRTAEQSKAAPTHTRMAPPRLR